MNENLFANVYFHGTFRKYQERVLSNSGKYLLDKKINIVAAPGSGKTILGLELIRRLNNKAIILTPTTTIKYQWGERFKKAFLDEETPVENYISYDLNKPKLVNVITYQALYSTMKKVMVREKEDDFSKLDIITILQNEGIKTICLDEAHHLKNQWQKALNEFLAKLSKDVTILSLTATPPYDANASEWKRYIETCGEIDEEIFVPELVKEKTLCPHQDYIYFNKPSKEETQAFKAYREEVKKAIDETNKLLFFNELAGRIRAIYREDESYVYGKAYLFFLVEAYLKSYGFPYDKKIYRKLKGFPYRLNHNSIAKVYDFLLKDERLLKKEEKKELEIILRRHGVMSRLGIELTLSDSLKRRMISSIGKLQSIVEIVESEIESMKENLRLLILTDFIKKEDMRKIGTKEGFQNLSIVSIFETLRREGYRNIGVLSGALILLPKGVKEEFKQQAVVFKEKELGDTGYSVFSFEGSNQQKVGIVTRLFEKGLINILIGTQSLLGEGYDSPCINSLIMASYIGSFVLSNQMRGRAIRIDKNHPNKTANIFHLVTIETEGDFSEKNNFESGEEEDISEDLATLKRRFKCFIGPNYETGELESGIERVTILKKFSQKNFKSVNEEMLIKSRERQKLFETWENALAKYDGHTYFKAAFEKKAKIPSFSFVNAISISILYIVSLTISIAISSFARTLFQSVELSVLSTLLVALAVFALAFASRGLYYLILHHDPNRSFRLVANSLYKAMVSRGYIDKESEIRVESDETKRIFSLKLENATFHEQSLFMDAIKELFSPIEEPRYLLLRRNMLGMPDYKYVFSCPDCFSLTKSDVYILKKELNKIFPSFTSIYTRREEGYKVLIRARRKSFVNKNDKRMKNFIDFK